MKGMVTFIMYIMILDSPLIDDNLETNELFIESFLMVPIWGSHLSPVDETMWDISPIQLGM